MKYLILLTLLVSCSQGPVGKCYEFEFFGGKFKIKVDEVQGDTVLAHMHKDLSQTKFKLTLEDLKLMEEISCK